MKLVGTRPEKGKIFYITSFNINNDQIRCGLRNIRILTSIITSRPLNCFKVSTSVVHLFKYKKTNSLH